MPLVLADVTLGAPSWRRRDQRKDHVSSFCAFILFDLIRRAPLVKRLVLETYAFPTKQSSTGRYSRAQGDHRDLDYSSAASLAHVIRQCTNLEHLVIADAEELFGLTPAMGDAVAELRQLRSVKFDGIRSRTLQVFSQMKSPIESIDGSIDDDGRAYPGLHGPFLPAQARWLWKFTTSLTELRMCNQFGNFVDLGTTWPAVHSLELYTIYPIPFTTSEIAHAFPNLRRLVLNDMIHQADDTIPRMGWLFLDFVSMRTPRLLGQTVRHLHFHSSPEITGDVRLAEAILHQLSPVVLGCRAEECMLKCMVSSAPSVRILQVFDSRPPREATESAEAFAQHIERLVTSLCPILQSTRLCAFTMSVECPIPDLIYTHDSSPYASAIAHLIPSLQYVGLQLVPGGTEWDQLRYDWFQVEARPEAGIPIVEKLPKWRGSALEVELLATPRE